MSRTHERTQLLEIKQLQALVTVAEVGSITKAAALLHLVQPAVTRQIRALEDELGVDLFERTRQGMRATPAGVAMVERARRALTELERARAELRPRADHVTGIVTVGLLESVLDVVAGPFTAAVTRRHPGIELRLLTAYSGHLQQWLDAGDVDLSLLYNMRSTSSVHARPLLHEAMWAVAPPDAGLRTDEPVDLAALATHPIVMPVAGHGLRVIIDQACARATVSLDVAVETNSMRLQKQLVIAGYGWTILPSAGVADDVARGILSAAPVSAPTMSRLVVLGRQRSGRIPPAVETVAHELVEVIHSVVACGAWPSAELIEGGPTRDGSVGREEARIRTPAYDPVNA